MKFYFIYLFFLWFNLSRSQDQEYMPLNGKIRVILEFSWRNRVELRYTLVILAGSLPIFELSISRAQI